MSATSDPASPAPPVVATTADGREVIYRHRLPVRLSHWANALILLVLLMSGLGIFNAHPRLYLGREGWNREPAALDIHAAIGPDGRPRGVLQIGGLAVPTTGVLGLSSQGGQLEPRAFPHWATLPGYYDLAGARRWHFFFAWLLVLNGAAYLVWSFASRHLQRDLWPSLRQLRGIGRSLWEHLLNRHPRGEEAKRYNVLQKLSYLGVIFVALPLIVLTGMTMSPGLDAVVPLADLFGGRQTARTLHFACAFALVAFFLVHVAETLLAGALNEIRSIVTGRYVVPKPLPDHPPTPEAPHGEGT